MSYYNYEDIEHCVMSVCGNVMSYAQPIINAYMDPKFDIDEVSFGLYIGDFPSACNTEKLKQEGITHIVTAIAGVGEMYPDLFKYYIIDICDRKYSHIQTYFDESSDFIDNAITNGGKVLVHCQKGISRSSTIVAAYLIKKKGQTTDEAIETIKKGRNCIQPNVGFKEQLQNYQNLMTKNTEPSMTNN